MADGIQKRQRLDRRLADLKLLRNEYEEHWRELADYVRPDRLRLETPGINRGQKNREKIRDSAAGFALRTLQSGMHSGITSPSRPWFRLTTFDPDLAEQPAVKEWLATNARMMREVFARSNFYPAMHTSYGDLALFGQSVGILVDDPRTTIHIHQILHGEFWLAADETGVIDTLYRRIPMTVEQIVRRWGLDKVSNAVKQMWSIGKKDERVNILHAIEPRADRDPTKIDGPNKAFMSVYWEEGANGPSGGILQDGGFDENPILAPRWEVLSTDTYGISPGMDALPDVKALQLMQVRKLEGIDKMVRPPMKGPNSLKGQPASLLPGSITYVDDPNGQGFTPAMQVQLRLGELMQEMEETRERIRQTYFADLFLMISQMEGIQPRNQFEIAERKEEKLLMLGPVLERVHNELLAPAIDRTFEIMIRRGMVPPAPPELEGQDLDVEYISILAQAQKAVATGSIERVASFVGNLAGVYPAVIDKFDADQAVDEYSELLGAPPGVIVPDERVEAVRAERAQKAEQQEQMAQMAAMAPAAEQGAQAAKVLSETPSGGRDSTTSLLQRLGLG